MKIKVICYGKELTFTSRKYAIAYFKEGMKWCDPFSSEFGRYADIVAQLEEGNTFATDEI